MSTAPQRSTRPTGRDAQAAAPAPSDEQTIAIHVSAGRALTEPRSPHEQFARSRGAAAFHAHPSWLSVFRDALRQEPYAIVATRGDRLVGLLPLALVSSRLFGRFLVSLPYLNTAGVVADDEAAAVKLIDRALALADELDVKHLELRHERPIDHPALNHELTTKVHMRLALPDSADALWKQLRPKVRNQIRKGRSNGLHVRWGGMELLADFYSVVSRNMRDLGTPVYSRRLFQCMLDQFPDEAEICTVYDRRRPVASGLVVHKPGTTEVPSASSLRRYNSTNANMLMYWHFLERSIERGQCEFDFGRSSHDSGTYRFKKQWGTEPAPAVWQYYVRRGSVDEMRPEHRRYGALIRIWRRLPVWLARLIGPTIVRGIP